MITEINIIDRLIYLWTNTENIECNALKFCFSCHVCDLEIYLLTFFIICLTVFLRLNIFSRYPKTVVNTINNVLDIP